MHIDLLDLSESLKEIVAQRLWFISITWQCFLIMRWKLNKNRCSSVGKYWWKIQNVYQKKSHLWGGFHYVCSLCHCRRRKQPRRKQTKCGGLRFGMIPDLTRQSVSSPLMTNPEKNNEWRRRRSAICLGGGTWRWLSLWLVRQNLCCCHWRIQTHVGAHLKQFCW